MRLFKDPKHLRNIDLQMRERFVGFVEHVRQKVDRDQRDEKNI